MPFVPTPSGVKVCMKFTKAGQQCCNVFHVKVPTAPDEADLETIAGIFEGAWVDNMKLQTTSDVELTGIEVTDISVAGGIGIEHVPTTAQIGGNSAGALPNNATLATKLLTGRTGRSYRGRFYMVGVPFNNLQADRQHVNSTITTALQNFVSELVAALLAEGLNLAVASFFSGGAPRTEGVLTDVTGASVNTTIDSQRRRLPERGA